MSVVVATATHHTILMELPKEPTMGEEFDIDGDRVKALDNPELRGTLKIGEKGESINCGSTYGVVPFFNMQITPPNPPSTDEEIQI